MPQNPWEAQKGEIREAIDLASVNDRYRIPVDGTSAGRGSISRPLHRWSYENLLRQSLLAAAVDVGLNPRG